MSQGETKETKEKKRKLGSASASKKRACIEKPLTSVTYIDNEIENAIQQAAFNISALGKIVLEYIIPKWENEQFVYDTTWTMTEPTLNQLLEEKLVHTIDHIITYEEAGPKASITVRLKQLVTFPFQKPKRLAYRFEGIYPPWRLPFDGPANAVVWDTFIELSNGMMFYCLHGPYHDPGDYLRYVCLS